MVEKTFLIWRKTYGDLLYVYAVKAANLFHTKGFCLATYSDDEVDLVDGRLAIGSANLTGAGLTHKHGNIESLAIHSDIETIEKFLQFFEDEDILITPDELTDFDPDDPIDFTDFQYALLTRGKFSHKWTATLATYFSVRFQLNEEGRQRTEESIETPGFQMESATISKQYFDFGLQDWRPMNKNLVRMYGIECFLGHWVPKSKIEGEELMNENLFNKFKSAIFCELDLRMGSICREILRDCNSLVQEGIIDAPEIDPTESFLNKVNSLKNDRDQLYRIWSGRHFFDFPYDLGEDMKIKETYDDLILSAKQRQRPNTSMKVFLEAHEDRTLKPLDDLEFLDS